MATLNKKEDAREWYATLKLPGCELMIDGLVQFEAKIQSFKNIRSRVIWPDSEGPLD